MSLKNLRILLGILALTAFIYASSLHNGFISWDDAIHLTENPQIRPLTFSQLKEIFTSITHKSYIPLTTLSWAVEYHFFGMDSFVFHLNNLILHLLNISLVFLLGIQLGLMSLVAGGGALLFGIHPMHVESVAWVTERKDVLYGFFYLSSLSVYLRYLNTKRKRFLYLTVGLGFLSMLAKPMAMTLPFILFLLDNWCGRKDWKNLIIEKLFFFMYIVPLAYITYIPCAYAVTVNSNWIVSILSFIWTLTFYIQKFCVPLVLVPIYHQPHPVSLFNAKIVWSLLLFGLLIFSLIRFSRARLFMFAFLFYVISIFPVLHFDRELALGYVADRYMYIPSIGFCFLLVFGWEQVQKLFLRQKDIKRWGFYLLSGIFVLGLAIKTFQQTKIWKDNISFYNFILRYLPGESFAYLNRGVAHADTGKLDAAISDYNQALHLSLDNYKALHNLGNIYAQHGQFQTALDYFNQALAHNPQYWMALHDRGKLYGNQGNFRLALDDFNAAIRLQPSVVGLYLSRGNVYFEKEDWDSALWDYQRAKELDPFNAEAWNNLGNIYFRNGNNEKALDYYSKAISLRIDYRDAYFNRAIVYEATYQWNLALSDLSKALGLDPDAGFIVYEKSLIFLGKKDYQLALENAIKAKELGYPVEEQYLNQLKQETNQASP